MTLDDIIYNPPSVEVQTDFDKVKGMVTLYSLYRKLKGEVRGLLNDQLCTLLSIYVINGYSKEVKEKAAKIIGTKYHNITQLNKKLRDSGYIYPDTYNSNINFVCEPLAVLGGYYQTCTKEGKDFVFAFTLSHKDEEGSLI